MANKKNMFSSAMNNLAISQPITANNEEEPKEEKMDVTPDVEPRKKVTKTEKHVEPEKTIARKTGFANELVFSKQKKDPKHSRTIYVKDSHWNALKALCKEKGVSATDMLAAIFDEALGFNSNDD